MKNYTLLFTLFFLLSCSKNEQKAPRYVTGIASASSQEQNSNSSKMQRTYSSLNGHALPPDIANRMIKSYLNSIGYPDNQSTIRSWTLDAEALRSFICEGNGSKMSKIKVMLAHTMEYIQAGNERKAGMDKADALTLVFVGVDEENNYIYSPEGDVLDHCFPCPTQCLGSGEVANDLLIY